MCSRRAWYVSVLFSIYVLYLSLHFCLENVNWKKKKKKKNYNNDDGGVDIEDA